MRSVVQFGCCFFLSRRVRVTVFSSVQTNTFKRKHFHLYLGKKKKKIGGDRKCELKIQITFCSNTWSGDLELESRSCHSYSVTGSLESKIGSALRVKTLPPPAYHPSPNKLLTDF